MEHLLTAKGLEKCVHPAWTRRRFEDELKRLVATMESSPTAGQWTTIALQVDDGDRNNLIHSSNKSIQRKETNKDTLLKKGSVADDHTVRFCSYLQMLARSRNYGTKMGSNSDSTPHDIKHAIEGSLKLAQHLKFPRQDILGLSSATLPQWYGSLLELQPLQTESVQATSAIQSVSALGKVYGLSIMDQAATTIGSYNGMAADSAMKLLHSNESKSIDAACRGEWGSETCLNPALTDTSLLLTKLNALQVPPLPPRLSEERSPVYHPVHPSRQQAGETGDPRDSQVWKPKIHGVIASSRRAPEFGHTAPTKVQTRG